MSNLILTLTMLSKIFRQHTEMFFLFPPQSLEWGIYLNEFVFEFYGHVNSVKVM